VGRWEIIISYLRLVPPTWLQARSDNPLPPVKVQMEFHYRYHFGRLATSAIALLIREWNTNVGA